MSDSVDAALKQARALGLERLDAQLLLAQSLQQPRAWLIAHGEAALSSTQQQSFTAACRRRAGGEPLAYLLGEREFHGLMLQVSPAVLVPRPDSETLVDWALEHLAEPRAAAPQVADLGTGSGAIALALKHRHGEAKITAVDISAEALQVARANAASHRLQVEFLRGDWWQPLQGRRFDLVVANAPYIAADDPHMHALRHEPRLALTPGGNGLSAISQIVTAAPPHLADGGWLLLEHGFQQAGEVRRLLISAGFQAVQTRTDLAHRPRCTGGRLMHEPRQSST